MMKTAVVEIGRTFRHPLYKKVVHTSRRVKAQDEMGCQIGDLVQIVETRPISKDKRWAVEAILKHKGVQVVTAVEDEVVVVVDEGVVVVDEGEQA
jgi:small subunit ribosomal protein S17